MGSAGDASKKQGAQTSKAEDMLVNYSKHRLGDREGPSGEGSFIHSVAGEYLPPGQALP